MKLWAMPCSATQDRRVMRRDLTKRGPLEKGMANHFSILALRTPWTVWKGKKNMTLKDELLRLVDAQYATGEEWRNNSRKNEDIEPKWKQCPVMDVTLGSWWWTGRPGVLRFMGSQRVGHDWAADLIWSDLEKGMANYFSTLALRTPWTVLKGKKDMTLKDELPSLVGAQYATGEEWRKNSRRNEEAEPSRNNAQFGCVWWWK